MIEWLTCSAAILVVFWFYKRTKPKPPKLTKVVPDWSPINILWLDSLPPVDAMSEVSMSLSYEHNNSVSDKASWSVLPDSHLSARLGEELGNFASSPDTDTHVVCQVLHDLPLASPRWE